MGSVVSFSPRSAAVTRTPPPTGSTGSVVIFPGIRYERATSLEPVTKAAAVNPAEGRRDTPAPRH